MTEGELRRMLDSIFDEYDQNKDGQLSYEELVKMLNAIYKRQTGK